jgi:HlyD family secretion protein
MMLRLKPLGLLLPLLCLGCAKDAAVLHPTERVVSGPVSLQVETEGEVRAARATPLNVPGQQWTRRQPIWLLNDGSQVEAGDLIARFSPELAELELSQIMLDLQRNQIARLGKREQLDGAQARVDIDLVEVATRLSIAQRYATIDLAEYFSRNEILDAIDDERSLNVRRGVLEWKRDQSTDRGATEIAVLDAQQSSHQRNADARRADLNALELRAPHGGVLMLAADWAGEKPRVGINLMAGQPLGYLPDFAALEVELKLPQLEAQALSVGQTVQLHLLGRPDQVVSTKLSSVAASAQVLSRENPAPYLTARASLPAEAVRSLGLAPGMLMEGRIEVLNRENAITVPNIALREDRSRTIVHVRVGGDFEPREIVLGARGVTRTEVTSGLKSGDEILLTPQRPSGAT